jgi:hypothetical protein
MLGIHNKVNILYMMESFLWGGGGFQIPHPLDLKTISTRMYSSSRATHDLETPTPRENALMATLRNKHAVTMVTKHVKCFIKFKDGSVRLL